MEGHTKRTLDFAGEGRAIPGGEHLERCYSCGACVSTCMVQQKLDPDFNPRRLLRLVMMGDREEAFKSPATWLCSGCDLCYPACPQKIHISQVIGAVKHLAVEAGQASPLKAALVDKAACFACGTCVEVCPYEAVSLTSGQVSISDPVAIGVELKVEKKYTSVDPNRCMGCGICAASCLASCITPEKSTDKKIEAQARTHEHKEWSPRLAVFVCDWSVRPETDQAVLTDPPHGVHVVRVPCSGRITPTFLVTALQKGFDGVLVIGCRPGECHFKQGNLIEQARLSLAGSFLDLLGLEEKRLRFKWMPTGSRGELTGLFERMLGELRELGTIAWRLELDTPVRGPKHGMKTPRPKLGEGRLWMLADLREVLAAELENLDGIVALRQEGPDVAPYLYRRGEALDSLVLSPYFPLTKTVDLILDAHPEARIGIVARGCDERALVELANWNQVDPEHVKIIGLPCTAEEAAECGCHEPYPSTIAVGEKVSGAEDKVLQEFLATHSREERMAFWRRQFAKCIKCYGCRDVCPLCFCNTCALEQDHWVAHGRVEPPFPTFHMIKAMHTAGSGKCTQCGECERACPAGIPLTLLYALLRGDVKRLFDYEAGTKATGKPPAFRFEIEKA